MQTFFLEFPLPPTINSYYQFNGHRRFVGAKGVQFKKDVAHIVSQFPIRFGNARLELTITLHFKTKLRQDLSNRVKALEDALVQAGLFDDDSQIDIEHVYRGNVIKAGKTIVQITVIDQKL